MALPRTLARLGVAAAFGVAVLDGGSTALTTLQVPDRVQTVGRVAATASVDKPIDRATAVAAYNAAKAQADTYGIAVDPRTFILQPDGRITLTGTKTAPTLVAGHIGPLRHLTRVRSTATVEAPTIR